MMKISVTTKKNLLAFSAGVDSSALFFLLLQNNIEFDIAIVDYHQRKTSTKEVEYAKFLTNKYNKQIYISNFSKNEKFSEKTARDFRYSFFAEIIKQNDYDSLITAHQLNDKLEWFLMQLTKGAGVVELLGMQEKELRDGVYFLKPLLNVSKDELLDFLHLNNIKYFIDESNKNEKYKRNSIRENVSNFMVENFKDGIKRSFKYLQKDSSSLLKINILKQNEKYYELENMQDNLLNIRAVDKILKKLGVLLSQKQKEEILQKEDVVMSHKIVVVIKNEKIFIAPYMKTTMSKKQKEFFRIQKIPPKLRGYLASLPSKNVKNTEYTGVPNS